jgi:hypothetical protein
MDDSGIDVAVVSLSTPGVQHDSAKSAGFGAPLERIPPNWFVQDRTGFPRSAAVARRICDWP